MPMANLPALEWRDLTLQLRRTVRAPDAVRVHDLRVAIRRFNQLIAAVDDSAGNSPRVRQRLKKIMTLAGGVRDLDIAIKLIGRLEPSKTLSRDLSRRRTKAATALVTALRGWTGSRAAACAAELSASKFPPGAARKILLRTAKRLFDRGKRAEKRKASASGLHRVRIAAKKFRYTLELVNPAYPRLDRIKRLQSMLGDINDCETASVIVKRIAGPASKKLRQRLRQKQAAKIRNFRVYWKTEFSSPAAVRRWMLDMSKLSR